MLPRLPMFCLPSSCEIRIKLAPQAEARLRRTSTVEPLAYEAFLRGRYFWNQRTRKALENSLQQFRESIRHDHEYAPADAGMADSYLSLLDDAYLPPLEATAQARQWAEKAIAIDEAFAEPHSSLGHAHFHEFEWTDAEREFRRSIVLNPNYPSAHFYYVNYLVAMGPHQEAVSEARKALALDPVNLAAQTNVAIILYHAGRYGEAVEEARRVLELDTTYAHAHYVLGRAYVQKGMHREAIPSSRRAVSIPRNRHSSMSIRGWLFCAKTHVSVGYCANWGSIDDWKYFAVLCGITHPHSAPSSSLLCGYLSSLSSIKLPGLGASNWKV
jgi:tetratricopeptide (TPR) repeat protein